MDHWDYCGWQLLLISFLIFFFFFTTFPHSLSLRNIILDSILLFSCLCISRFRFPKWNERLPHPFNSFGQQPYQSWSRLLNLLFSSPSCVVLSIQLFHTLLLSIDFLVDHVTYLFKFLPRSILALKFLVFIFTSA